MAEEEDKGQEGQEEGTDTKSSGGKKNLILFIAIVVIVMIGSIGGTIFFLKGDVPPEEQEVVETIKPVKAIYHRLRPAFVVNYVMASKPRYLQADVTLMSRDPSAVNLIVDHTPLIRARIHSYLTGYDFISLQTFEGKGLLADELKTRINEELKAFKETDGVEAVLFTNFVLQ